MSELKDSNTDLKPETLKTLARNIQAGDHQAFKELFFLLHNPLCRFAASYTNNHHIAEEFVQDVFTYVWENRNNWNPDNVKSWLYTSVRNKALDHLKHINVREKNMRFVRDSYQNDKETPEQSLHTKNFEMAIEAAIKGLPDRCRNTYLLHRRENFSYSEIAEIMAVSVKTVESQMSRALMLLRDELEEYL